MTKLEQLKGINRKKDLLAFSYTGVGSVFETLKRWLDKGWLDMVHERLGQLIHEYNEYCSEQAALDAEFEEIFEDRKCLHEVTHV